MCDHLKLNNKFFAGYRNRRIQCLTKWRPHRHRRLVQTYRLLFCCFDGFGSINSHRFVTSHDVADATCICLFFGTYTLTLFYIIINAFDASIVQMCALNKAHCSVVHDWFKKSVSSRGKKKNDSIWWLAHSQKLLCPARLHWWHNQLAPVSSSAMSDDDCTSELNVCVQLSASPFQDLHELRKPFDS